MRDCEEAHGLIVDPQGDGDSDAPVWRVDSEMQVFDVFAHYVNDKAVNGDLVLLLNTHPDSLLARRCASPGRHLSVPLGSRKGPPVP